MTPHSERKESYRIMGLDYETYTYPEGCVLKGMRDGVRVPLLSTDISGKRMESVADRLRKMRAVYTNVDFYITIPSRANT